MKYILLFIVFGAITAHASGSRLTSSEEEDFTKKEISTDAHDGRITGEVVFQGNIEIPEDSIVTIRFSDVSLQDVAATTLAVQVIKNAGSFPVEFTISYDPKSVKSGRTYALSARIEQGEKLLFINDTIIPVISFDAPSKDVILPVIRVHPR